MTPQSSALAWPLWRGVGFEGFSNEKLVTRLVTRFKNLGLDESTWEDSELHLNPFEANGLARFARFLAVSSGIKGRAEDQAEQPGSSIAAKGPFRS